MDLMLHDYDADVDGTHVNLVARSLNHALYELGNLGWEETETIMIRGRKADLKEGDPT